MMVESDHHVRSFFIVLWTLIKAVSGTSPPLCHFFSFHFCIYIEAQWKMMIWHADIFDWQNCLDICREWLFIAQRSVQGVRVQKWRWGLWAKSIPVRFEVFHIFSGYSVKSDCLTTRERMWEWHYQKHYQESAERPFTETLKNKREGGSVFVQISGMVLSLHLFLSFSAMCSEHQTCMRDRHKTKQLSSFLWCDLLTGQQQPRKDLWVARLLVVGTMQRNLS